MLIEGYGIQLKSITEPDLELIRNWRNSEQVKSNMQYSDFISAEMQMEWYRHVEEKSDLYFIICFKGSKAGLINLKNILPEDRIAEAGIFIGEESYINSIIPVAATLLLMKFAFEVLMLKMLKAKIGNTNYKAIKFNIALGYQKIESKTEEPFCYYEVTSSSFYSTTKKLLITLNKSKNKIPAVSLTLFESEKYGLYPGDLKTSFDIKQVS